MLTNIFTRLRYQKNKKVIYTSLILMMGDFFHKSICFFMVFYLFMLLKKS